MKNYLQLKFKELLASFYFDLNHRTTSLNDTIEIKSLASQNSSGFLKKSMNLSMSNGVIPNMAMGLLLFVALLGFNQNLQGQSLNKGDIAFTSYNADEDGFSLVTFVDIPASTLIYFTDNEATGLTAFNSGESYFQWNTGATIIGAGTVVRFSSVDVATLAASRGTLTRATVTGNANYGISTTADCLYAFIGTSVTAPTNILTAISSGDTVSPGDVITNAGLTAGTNAIVIRSSADYGEYNGSRTGQTSFTNYKPLVFNVTNWTVDQIDGVYATTIPNTAAFTITPTVSLSVSANAGSEAGATAITVTATASSAVSGNQTVALAVSGTNITTGDYSLSNSTITILNGQTTGSVTFTVTDDTLVESIETATLTISSPSAGIALGTTTSQNITITDNDVAPNPSVSLSVSANTGSETGTTAITVTATASSAVSGDQTVVLAVSGTNITTGDYSLSNSTITILNGQTTGSVTFTVTDDTLVESTETATLTISSPSSGITLGTTTSQNIIITDNDVIPTVSLSVSANTGSEAGTTTITVTASASVAVTGNQTVALGVTGTGITAGDYTLSNATITILSGQTTGSVTFTIVDDILVESVCLQSKVDFC